ncbi:MAG TPA: hypothetical protein VGG20_07995 [Thermoanaerobaculia bacterium]|jgi:hypothetical protein
MEEGRLEVGEPDWGPAKRILFRFGFTYLFLYLLSTFLLLLAFIPAAESVVGWYFELWSVLVPWIARHLFQATALPHSTGSGDSLYRWMQVACFATLAALVALVWTLVDRKRKSYPRLYEGLRLYVRLGLGMTMMQYGAFKIIPSQFPHPSLDRLLQSIGDSSPMGILWTFMGASASYTIFAGLTEWIGGALLLFRRTARLGALVSIAALTNVVVLNFCYDVPVKQYSVHLLAMAVFLAAPDLRRLADLLVLNRHVPPADDRPLFRRQWLQLGGMALEMILLVGFTWYALDLSYQQYRSFGAASLPLHGIWEVDELVVGGEVRPLVVTDASRWRYVVFDYSDLFSILPMNNSRQRYVVELNEAKKTLALTKRYDPAWKSTLTYQQPGPALLTLDGTFDGKPVRASLHRIEASKSLLVTRGFHWVSEYPFNR